MNQKHVVSHKALIEVRSFVSSEFILWGTISFCFQKDGFYLNPCLGKINYEGFGGDLSAQNMSRIWKTRRRVVFLNDSMSSVV